MNARFLFLLLFCCFFYRPAVSAPADIYDEGWLKLLHYQPQKTAYVSIVENDSFFLTNGGRYQPLEEYNATIKAFNTPHNKKKCDFPARFLYLQKKGLVAGDLTDCKDYQKFLEDLQPQAVTLLFTNAYMNNPSSLFGHTLFRIDTKRQGTQILAHGANFGADTGDDSGILYALKGLWGGYYGTFGIKPYFDVINLYNNIENRDIWEYELNFSAWELTLFTAHLWEIQQAKIRYYFMNKNCSYVLLLMLEAVKPDLELSSDFIYSAPPLATLKAVENVPQLIKKSTYRPSRQSKLKHRINQMSRLQYQKFLNIIHRNNLDLTPLSSEEKADVLETAYQYFQYNYFAGNLDLPTYRKQSFKLLLERNKIANHKQYFNELKAGEDPIKAHKLRQFGLSIGSRTGKMFQDIHFKPAYTSLLDDSYGLLQGAEINFFDTQIRHYDTQNKYVLQTLNLLEIKSLPETDAAFWHPSYEILTSIRRLFNAKTGEETTGGLVNVGGGLSYMILPHTRFYVLNTYQAVYGGGLPHNGYTGVGFKGGLYYNYERFRLILQAQQDFTSDNTASGQTYSVKGGYGLSRNLMLYGSYQKFNSAYHDNEEISFGVKVNF